MKNLRNIFETLFLSIVISIVIFPAHAGDDLLFEDEFKGDIPIDVDGQYQRKRASDKLAKARKALEHQNEDLVQKKIENLRLDNERKMTKTLQNAFRGKLENSKPVSSNVVTKSVKPSKKAENKGLIKLIPSFGVVNLVNKNLDIESKIQASINLETLISDRFSIGLGFSYMNVEMTDIGSNQMGTIGGGNYFNNFYNHYSPTYGQGYNQLYNNFYGQNYYDQYGQGGRQIKFKNFTVEINSKFFLLTNKRIRPYLGLGVNYNRGILNYEDNNYSSSYQWNSYQLGGEAYHSSFIGMQASVGTEVEFSKHIGLNLELKYGRGLTSELNGQSAQSFMYNPDQERLERLGAELTNVNLFNINAGLLVKF